MSEVAVPLSLVGPLGPVLGSGGQARVSLAPALALPDAAGPLVYKQYREHSLPPHGLRALVAMRNRLTPEVRAKLDARTCWPVRVVEDGGTVRGVVLPLIPDGFMRERLLPSGRMARGPVEVQNLMVAPALTRRLGLPCPTPAQRLRLCRDFAAAMHLVHRLDLVIGDINARNALYRLDGPPHVMLVDCDAVRIKGSVSVVAQLNAPDWDPPARGELLTQATDRYKFGLFVLRCLAPGSMISINRDPSRADAALDADGRRMLRAALSADPPRRPTAQEWGRYLDMRLRAAPPEAPRRPVAMPPRTKGARRRDPSGVWRKVK